MAARHSTRGTRGPGHARRREQAGLMILLLIALLLALAPVIARADSVTLAWTAPGDDGNLGTATSYDVRWSTAPISAANFASANQAAGVPAPQASGTRQTFVVNGLSRDTTYYFAIKTSDEVPNQSGISNTVTWDWVYDTAPPAIPSGGRASRQGASDVLVRWNPNSEPDLFGYSVYRSLSASGPFSALSFTSSTELVDSNVPSGTETVWYQVTASDQAGNESGRSASFSVSLAAQVEKWDLDAAYPNPSRLSGPVSIPVVVPTSGAGNARLDIVDAGGHVIRRLDLSGLGAGQQTVAWDGKNHVGRDLAPGVFTAWLIAGDTRSSVRLVRVP